MYKLIQTRPTWGLQLGSTRARHGRTRIDEADIPLEATADSKGLNNFSDLEGQRRTIYVRTTGSSACVEKVRPTLVQW